MDAKEYLNKKFEGKGVEFKIHDWANNHVSNYPPANLLESYHQDKSKEEAQVRYEKAKNSLINLELIEEVERGTFTQLDYILKSASGKE